MINELNMLFHAAEDSYLQDSDLQYYEASMATLESRLALYEMLRDSEEKIFQRLALSLREDYPDTAPAKLQLALKHWILILRYCAMAMLLEDSEFLKYRLLEWMTDVVSAHELQDIESSLYQMLKRRLKKFMSGEQLDLLNPYLSLAQEMLMEKSDSEIALF